MYYSYTIKLITGEEVLIQSKIHELEKKWISEKVLEIIHPRAFIIDLEKGPKGAIPWLGAAELEGAPDEPPVYLIPTLQIVSVQIVDAHIENLYEQQSI